MIENLNQGFHLSNQIQIEQTHYSHKNLKKERERVT